MGRAFTAGTGVLALGCSCLWGCTEAAPLPPEQPPPPRVCPVGEVALSDGSCRAPGVGACADGFEADGEGGCRAILPDETCPSGTMAVPGDAACRPVAECSQGTWDFVATAPDTEHVDAAYTGGNSDGSMTAPWTTIQAAVDAALPGAVVAVQDGSYTENLVIELAPVRLWGRCPSRVEIVGTGGFAAVLVLTQSANDTEVHQIAVRGPTVGVAIAGVDRVLLDKVWIHDTATRALDVIGQTFNTGGIVRDSLLVGASEVAVFLVAAGLVVERSAIVGGPSGSPGIFARPGDGAIALDERSSMSMTASVVDDTMGTAISIAGSDVWIDATLVRDIASLAGTGEGGFGIAVAEFPGSLYYSVGEIRRSVVERGHEAGIIVEASNVRIEDTVAADTEPRPSDDKGGHGIVVQYDTTGAPAEVAIIHSLVRDNRSIGVWVAASSVTADGVLVRRTLPHPAGDFGDGLLVASFGGGRATVEVSGSWIEASARAGAACFGATLRVSDTVLECNALDLDNELHEDQTPLVEDLGGNHCGCAGVENTCRVVSENLSAPAPPL